MEWEPMLTPREKSPLPGKSSSEEDRTYNTASRRTASSTHYQQSYSGPPTYLLWLCTRYLRHSNLLLPRFFLFGRYKSTYMLPLPYFKIPPSNPLPLHAFYFAPNIYSSVTYSCPFFTFSDIHQPTSPHPLPCELREKWSYIGACQVQAYSAWHPLRVGNRCKSWTTPLK